MRAAASGQRRAPARPARRPSPTRWLRRRNFESSDPENNSIVLTWDEVDNADTYEVEQRRPMALAGTGMTRIADDSGSNEVDDAAASRAASTRGPTTSSASGRIAAE